MTLFASQNPRQGPVVPHALKPRTAPERSQELPNMDLENLSRRARYRRWITIVQIACIVAWGVVVVPTLWQHTAKSAGDVVDVAPVNQVASEVSRSHTLHKTLDVNSLASLSSPMPVSTLEVAPKPKRVTHERPYPALTPLPDVEVTDVAVVPLESFVALPTSATNNSATDNDFAQQAALLDLAVEIAAERPLESLALCLKVNDLLGGETLSGPRSAIVAQQSHLLRALLLGLRVAEPVLVSLPQVESIAVSQSGRFVAAACHDGTVKLWDGQRREVTILAQDSGHVVSLCITPDERFVITGQAEGTVTWWRTRPTPGQSTTEVFTLPIALPGLRQVALSPDGCWMVAFTGGPVGQTTNASANRDFQGRAALDNTQCLLWNTESITRGQRLADVVWHKPISLRGHSQPVRTVAFCRRSQWLAVGSEDGSLRVYDLATTVTGIGLSVIKSHTGSVLSIAVAPDHSWIATGGDDNSIRIWGLQQGAAVPLATLTGHRGWVTVLAALPDSQTLLSGGFDQQLIAWDIAAIHAGVPHAPTVLATNIGGVRQVEISPDGSLLAALSGTSSLQLWRIDKDGSFADPITLFPSGAGQFPIADIRFDANNRLIHAVPHTGGHGWAVQRLPLNRTEMNALAGEIISRVAETPPPKQR